METHAAGWTQSVACRPDQATDLVPSDSFVSTCQRPFRHHGIQATRARLLLILRCVCETSWLKTDAVCVCDFRLFIPWIRSPKCLCPRETTTTKQWRRWSAEALSYWPDMQLSSSCSSYQVGRRRKTQHRSSFCSPFLLFISFRGQ